MKINTVTQSMRPVRARINTKALASNLARVKQLAPESRIISVIKANAYGHGVLPVASALKDSDCFAVARIDEAMYLRCHGIENPIVLLEGVLSIDEYHQCADYQLIPAIHNIQQFKWLETFFQQQEDSTKLLNYWLKVDTGMHRLGLLEEELKQLIDRIACLQPEQMPSGIMSHFSCADEIDNAMNVEQQALFEACFHLKNMAKLDKSMANSAAILSMSDSHYDWVRPGIMLYGVSPFESASPMRTGRDEQLTPVMTLSSEIIAIKKLKQGDCIGYGASWCCSEETTVGVIAIGYGDGYPRHAANGTPVLIHGVEVPLIGRVSMDMITVDLSVLEKQSIEVSLGDTVTLWGEGLPIEKVSQKAGTIAYELLCQITQRVYFEYE